MKVKNVTEFIFVWNIFRRIKKNIFSLMISLNDFSFYNDMKNKSMNNSNIILFYHFSLYIHISSATFNLSNHINILSRPPTRYPLENLCKFSFRKKDHITKRHTFLYINRSFQCNPCTRKRGLKKFYRPQPTSTNQQHK